MTARVLELRVHGVSNTSPQTMLREREKERPEPRLAAGDEQTGFYRRRGDSDDAELVTEAYSWGQLTSGLGRAQKDLQRAGWSLLLPFALVNVALWARPDVPAEPGQERSRSMWAAIIVRLLALCLTATLTMAAVGVGMDQVGWQCREGCANTIWGTDFLSDGGFWAMGLRPVAVGMLAPVVLLLLLWLLARRSFAYEAELPEPGSPPAPAPATLASQLEHPSFWSGDGQVRRLAALHLAAALVTLAGVAFAAGRLVDNDLDAAQRPADWVQWIGWAAAFFLVLAVFLALIALRTSHVRQRAPRGMPTTGYGVLPIAALICAAAGTLAAAAYLLIPDRAGVRSLIHGPLPGFANGVSALFVAQFFLVLMIAALGSSGRRALAALTIGTVALVVAWVAHDTVKDAVGDEWALFVSAVVVAALIACVAVVEQVGRQDASTPVWGGRSAAMLAGAGWVTGSLYSAAVLFWVADWLNGDRTVTGSASQVVLPPALLWSATGLLVFVLPLVIVAVAAAAQLRNLRGDEFPKVKTRYQLDQRQHGHAHELAQARAVAQWAGIHRFVGEKALGWVGLLAVIVVVFAVVCIAGTFTGKSPVQLVTSWSWDKGALIVKWLTDTGSALAALLLLGLAAIVGLAYRSPGPRRTIGVVWDIATFWPRGAHPFAPPCYGERVVPQLLTRVCRVRESHVVLAGHSQGALLSVAAILQLPAARRDHVYLLTFGTQLTRLYGRVFPAFFGAEARCRIAGRLTLGSSSPRWTSLHRPTDPLGWEIEDPACDIELTDPEALAPTGGEILDPPIRQHSDYPCAKEYIDARKTAVKALTGSDLRSPRRRRRRRLPAAEGRAPAFGKIAGLFRGRRSPPRRPGPPGAGVAVDRDGSAG